MKKVLALIIALSFCLCACAEGLTGLANPYTQYETLDEINNLVGCMLCRPAVMGVTDEVFYIVDCGEFLMAEYDFCVNGIPYTFRCASAYYEDISGVYINGETAFGAEAPETIEFAEGEGMLLARWFDVNGQYCLILDNGEGAMNMETFEGIASELKENTSMVLYGNRLKAYIAYLAGDYMDSVSERATLSAVANEDDSLGITVRWSSSAFEYTVWKMNAYVGEDGLLNYTDCVMQNIVCLDDGSEEIETVYENGEGFFGQNEGVLYWNGAADENCAECEFIKVEE